MDKSILVPLGLFISVVYVIQLLVDARMRWLFFRGDSPEMVTAMAQSEERMRRSGALRWGVVLLSLGIGLMLARLLGWQAFSVESFALMLCAAGAGNLGVFALMRKLS